MKANEEFDNKLADLWFRSFCKTCGHGLYRHSTSQVDGPCSDTCECEGAWNPWVYAHWESL